MNQEKVLKAILGSESLPTLSTVAYKLISMTAKSETTISDIAHLITQDVSLSAKILKVVNSSFYSFPGEVTTIQQAVAILGTNAVHSLVLSFTFLNLKRSRKAEVFDYERFWEESLAAAVCARMLVAQNRVRIEPEEAFTVSLLQNLGILVLAQTFPEVYDDVLRDFSAGKGDLLDLEAERLGVTHPMVGAAVAEHWNFPKSLTIPILHHHEPDRFAGNDRKLHQTIQIAYLAGLVASIFSAGNPLDVAGRFRREARERLHLDKRWVDQILDNVSREVTSAADYFEIKITTVPPVPEILQRANIELSLLNMSYEQMNRELVAAKIELERINAELQQKNRYLESIANLDGLTEVYNHRYFQESLERELKRSLRSGRPLCLVLADLDHFKSINDRYGHQAGDFVLRELCRLWSGMLRDYDLLARYGGEEFVILLPETGLEEGVHAAEKLREAVQGHEFHQGAERYGVTSSFGIAMFDPEEEIKAGELIELADGALYQAKKKGRNRVELSAAKKRGWLEKLKEQMD